MQVLSREWKKAPSLSTWRQREGSQMARASLGRRRAHLKRKGKRSPSPSDNLQGLSESACSLPIQLTSSPVASTSGCARLAQFPKFCFFVLQGFCTYFSLGMLCSVPSALFGLTPPRLLSLLHESSLLVLLTDVIEKCMDNCPIAIRPYEI